MRAFVAALALCLAAAACSKTESGTSKTTAPMSGVIPVTADQNGFQPSAIRVKKGEPATLRFTRTTDETCADKVVFPDLKLEKDLPLKQPVDIPIDTKEPKTLAFQCGMGMYKSSVVIE